MSVIKRDGSKHWYIQFQFRGKTYIRSSKTTNKRVAEQMEHEWKAKLHAEQLLGQKARIRVRDALTEFCEAKKGTPNHANLVLHTRTLHRLFDVNRYVDEITAHDLERLKRDRLSEGVSESTLRHTFNLLRGSWKYVKKMGYQVSDVEFPRVKTPKHRLRYLTSEEEKRLLKELDPKREGKGLRRYPERTESVQQTLQDGYDLVVILLDTGARYSEIANVRWESINLTERTIALWRPKVQNESVLYMTDRVHRILERRHQERNTEYVFTNQAGGPRGYTSGAIRKAFRRAGLSDCSIHTLRHTHATRLIQNGMSIYEVKEILGHTDIKTTMRYAHLERRDVSSRARDVIDKLNRENGKPNLKVV